MTSPVQLRDDERFVIEAVAKEFYAQWSVGENPPDAYLTFGGGTVAVEITTLTQYVTDDHGTRPRKSDDAPIHDITAILNAQLHDDIPAGYSVGLVVSTPVLKGKKTTNELVKLLRSRFSNNASFADNLDVEIHGNALSVSVHKDEEGHSRSRKVWAVATNRASNPHIISNAMNSLADRISVKSKKCAALVGKRPLWLALYNDYWLAEMDTYQRALSQITISHPFDKILVINGKGVVFRLFEK